MTGVSNPVTDIYLVFYLNEMTRNTRAFREKNKMFYVNFHALWTGAGPGFERWVFKISNDVKNFDSPKLFQTGYRQYKLFFSPASNVPSDSSHVVPSYRFVKTSSINQQPRRQSSTSSVVTSVEQVTSWLCLPTHLGFRSHVYTNFGSLTLFISVV